LKILGYEILETGDNPIPLNRENIWIWIRIICNIHKIIFIIIKLEFLKWFYNTTFGMAITHKAWEKYKESPLFNFRYREMGIKYAIDSFNVNEFSFFKSKVWKDSVFLKELFFHPYETLDELLDSDTYWKKMWAEKISS